MHLSSAFPFYGYAFKVYDELCAIYLAKCSTWLCEGDDAYSQVRWPNWAACVAGVTFELRHVVVVWATNDYAARSVNIDVRVLTISIALVIAVLCGGAKPCVFC